MSNQETTCKEAEDLFFVVEICAAYTVGTEIPAPKRGFAAYVSGLFGSPQTDGYIQMLTWRRESAQGPLDHSTVATVLQNAADCKAAVEAHVSHARATTLNTDLQKQTDLEVSLWVGRPHEFVKRSTDPEKYWTQEGASGGTLIKGGEITAANITAFISRFDTPDTQAGRQRAQEELEAMISAAVAPVKNVKPMNALKLRKGP